MFVPVRVKSCYSLGRGTATLERLVGRAAALGLPAMALTDVDNLYGAIAFHRLARERGIRPLIGVELTATANVAGGEASALVLLARDRAGYENLCRLVTRRQLAERFDPIEEAPRFADGLIAMTEHPQALERLRMPDPSCRRLLLVRPGEGRNPETRERRLLEAAARFGVPPVADPHVVFLDPEDHPLHRLQVAIRGNSLMTHPSRPPPQSPFPSLPSGKARGGGCDEAHEVSSNEPGYGAAAFSAARCFPGPREWERRFGDCPEAAREALRLAELCDLDLSRPRPIFPAVAVPAGETPFSALSRAAFEGLRRRSRFTPRAMERLASELAMIDRLGFTGYFLVVGDIVRRARERGIEVVGRGSGASSIVAYALGVTNVDPIEYGLHFERFLHPGRTDLPDIDIDLCWIRRDEVIEDVYSTYGHGRVAMISSHITFQPRSAFREALRAFGVPPDRVNRYSKRIPHLPHDAGADGGPIGAPIQAAIRRSAPAREIPLAEEPYRTAVPLAERLIGLPHHLSIHPGGIVIADRPIDSLAPLERAAKGIVVTQYDMYSIEETGLVKIDLLGNRCLSELQETIQTIHPSRPPLGGGGCLNGDPGESNGPRLALADIPDGDPAAAELISAGRTIGCFQLESPAMRSVLRQLRARTVRECIAAISIIRPGPSEGGMKERYIQRAAGAEPVEFLHPLLRPVLEESHGIILYEEDVMRVIAVLAGLPLAEGDRMRSALKKCRAEEDSRQLENRFIGAAVRNGIEPDVAARAWRDLERFSGYCFNKAHASGYGLLAYQSAYLKAHHPVEFAAALLNHHAGMYSTRTIVEEARRLGVPILRPCVNRSGSRHAVEEIGGDSGPGPGISTGPGAPPPRGVRLALGQVKGLSESAIAMVLAERPFRSLNDLIRRTCIPRRELEALVLAGALDFTGLNHPQLLWELESTHAIERGRADPGSGDLGLLSPEERRLDHPPLPDYPPIRKVIHEIRHLELALTAHPLALLADRPELEGRVPAAAIESAATPAGARARVAGLLAASRRVLTRSGRMMQFITLEDESGVIEGTLFPEVYERHGRALSSLGPYVADGTVDERLGAVTLNIHRLLKLPLEPEASGED